MIKGDINQLIEWLDLNAINFWSLRNTNSLQGNNIVFESNIEQPREKEIERMRNVLALSENTVLYVNGRINRDKNVGNYSETWCNVSSKPAESVSGVKMGAVELANLGFVSADECQRRIEAAIEKANYERAKEDLERERREFREEKKEFDSIKDGAIGMLIQKAAPYIGSLFAGRTPMHNVAGIPGTVEADKIEARSSSEGNGSELTDGNNESSQVPDEPAEESVFTDEESDELFTLMEKWKNSDPQYLEVLNKVVDIATSGEPISLMGGTVKMQYDQLKDMLLKL